MEVAMKSILIMFTVAFLVCAPVTFAESHHHSIGPMTGQLWSMDDIRVNIDGGSVILTNEYEDGKIKITEDYELYVDGHLVKTNSRQKNLITEFHDGVFEVKDRAIKIGIKGAKIGVEGAGLGVKAVAGILKMIFTDYDEDDLDRDMEKAAQKIELKADGLEEEAQEIEDLVDHLEDMFYDMDEDIPEIHALGWS
jgi:hypothetical protein